MWSVMCSMEWKEECAVVWSGRTSVRSVMCSMEWKEECAVCDVQYGVEGRV